MIYVQFSDGTKTTIVSYFGSPQDPQAFPNQGTVEPTDPRWKTYYDKQSDFAKTTLPKPV